MTSDRLLSTSQEVSEKIMHLMIKETLTDVFKVSVHHLLCFINQCYALKSSQDMKKKHARSLLSAAMLNLFINLDIMTHTCNPNMKGT